MDQTNRLNFLKRLNIWPILVFVSILGCTFFVNLIMARQILLKDREIIRSYSSEMANSISAFMNQRLQLTYSLMAYVKVKPSITENDFLKFANATIGDATGVMSLQLAPNGIVKFVTNKKNNQKAIGHDLRGDPARRHLVERSIQERRYFIAGPIDLIQGGRAIVARNPIFLNDPNGEEYFWGFSTILLDVDMILQSAVSINERSNILFAIRGKDALGSKGDTFWGNPEVFKSKPVLENIVLPSGSWEVGAIRLENPPGLLETNIIVWLIGLTLATVSAWLIRKILLEPIILGKAIQVATHNLQVSKLEAERANRAKSEFLSRMSHELRTPMNAILGFTQLMQMDADNSPASQKNENLDKVFSAGKHLLKLINEILDLSRVESGKIELHIETINIVPIVKDAISTLKHLAKENNITIEHHNPTNGLFLCNQS